MTPSARIVAGLACLGVVGIAAACNAILDNDRGELVTTDEAGTEPPPDQPEVTPDSGEEPPPESTCPSGEHVCGSTCVSLDDPAFGCGSTSCAPCPSEHGTPTCSGGACALACDPGFGDCNQQIDDGCEADLSKPATCGGCDVTCDATAPLCTPDTRTGALSCSTGCTAAAPLLCGATCVDPNTSVNHCGKCDTTCAAVTNGVPKCERGKCTFTCNPDFHACPGKCAANTDATACGPACTACPTPVNGRPTCVANACAVECTVGFGDCDGLANTGCEATFATDAANCGACGVSCAGAACVNGVCQAPDAGTEGGAGFPIIIFPAR